MNRRLFIFNNMQDIGENESNHIPTLVSSPATKKANSSQNVYSL